MYQIPILPQVSEQYLNVTLEDNPYTIGLKYNVRFDFFTLSIAEKDGDLLLGGVKLVNNYPLIGRYLKTPLKGDFYLLHKGGKDIPPTYDNVGNEFMLYYYDDDIADVLPVPNEVMGATQSVWDSGNTVWDGGTTSWDA